MKREQLEGELLVLSFSLPSQIVCFWMAEALPAGVEEDWPRSSFAQSLLAKCDGWSATR